MMGLEEMRKNSELISVIDWDMTPEEAVTLYLEWGNNPANGRRRITSKNDVSYYFVVNTWEDPARIYYIRRNSEEAVELATIYMPEELRNRFLDSVGHLKGIYPVNDEIKAWLEEELYGQETNRKQQKLFACAPVQ
jgi:hypothetical protein